MMILITKSGVRGWLVMLRFQKRICLWRKQFHITKPIFFAYLIVLSFSLSLSTQAKNSFERTFADGSRIFSRDYTITEFRERPANVNEGVSEEKLFERQEWKLINYELWLQSPDNRPPELFWRVNDEYEVSQEKEFLSFRRVTVRDVYFSEPESYVLYMTSVGLVVARVEKKENIGWETHPAVLLEKEYGFRHIFDPKFKPGKKPVIEAKYPSGKTDESGSITKIWTWKINNNKWKKTR